MSEDTQPQRRSLATGRMTAVMRSAMVSGPKVLRIGMVKDDRVIDERIIRDRSTVTVGSNEKNGFVVGGATAPATLKVFERVGERYCLNFTDEMVGRVALPTGLSDLAALKPHARRSAQGTYQVALTEDARGKLTIGDATFLFQFVAPPPIQPKPQLPVSVLRGATTLDWTTTIIAAFVFLFDFLIIGAIYSDWFDQVIDERAALAQVIDDLKKLPPPPPPEPPKEEATDAGEDTTDTPTPISKPAERATKDAGPVDAAAAAAAAAAAKAAAEAKEAAELMAGLNESDQVMQATIGTTAATSNTSQDTLGTGSVPTGSLDAAAQSGAGVAVGGAGLKLRGAGGPLTPGAGGNALTGLGTTAKTASNDTGVEAKVKGPKASASVGNASAAGGQVADADKVIARLGPAFKNCYEKGLENSPDASGKITLKITLGLDGSVANVQSTVSGNLPDGIVQCVVEKVRSRTFRAPVGGQAVLTVPVNLVTQK